MMMTREREKVDDETSIPRKEKKRGERLEMVIIIPHAILEHLVKCHHKNRSYHHHHSSLILYLVLLLSLLSKNRDYPRGDRPLFME